jgi:hypothetical protein
MGIADDTLWTEGKSGACDGNDVKRGGERGRTGIYLDTL